MDLNEAARALIGVTPTHQQLLLIFKQNQGLSAPYYRAYCRPNGLDQLETKGIMWEALPIALEEWDSTLGAFTTAWGLVVRRIAKRQARKLCGVGSVIVNDKTIKDKGLQGSSLSTLNCWDLESIIQSNQQYNLEDNDD
jgi:hypothetical protein